MPLQVVLTQVGVDVLDQGGASIDDQTAGVDRNRAELKHERAVDELLADEDHANDSGEQVLPVTDHQGDAGGRHDPEVAERPNDLMKGLGIEHRVEADSYEQVGATNLPETVYLRMALVLIGGALPTDVDAG